MARELRSTFDPLPPQKTCTKCGVEKPRTEYTKHKLGRDGLRPRCRACTAEANLSYRAGTVAQRAAYNKSYRETNRDQHLAYNRSWNASNRSRCNDALRRYRAKHPELVSMRKALRRKLSAGRGSATLALQRVALYGGKCFYCGAVADTIDHRIPICRGGTNLPANLVPACRSCNSRKRHRTESEWKAVTQPSYVS